MHKKGGETVADSFGVLGSQFQEKGTTNEGEKFGGKLGITFLNYKQQLHTEKAKQNAVNTTLQGNTANAHCYKHGE